MTERLKPIKPIKPKKTIHVELKPETVKRLKDLSSGYRDSMDKIICRLLYWFYNRSDK